MHFRNINNAEKYTSQNMKFALLEQRTRNYILIDGR